MNATEHHHLPPLLEPIGLRPQDLHPGPLPGVSRDEAQDKRSHAQMHTLSGGRYTEVYLRRGAWGQPRVPWPSSGGPSSPEETQAISSSLKCGSALEPASARSAVRGWAEEDETAVPTKLRGVHHASAQAAARKRTLAAKRPGEMDDGRRIQAATAGKL